ncbi:hypothetical protein [Streptomyces gardneri]|uniref:hypothetical protein n=1 Tax=Streptomyces gardneri TaxID=66892 RepID=UPI0035E09C6A
MSAGPGRRGVCIPEGGGTGLVVSDLGRGQVAADTEEHGAADVVVLDEHGHALGDLLDVVGAGLRVGRCREDLDRATELNAAGVRTRDIAGLDTGVREGDLAGVLVRTAEEIVRVVVLRDDTGEYAR